MAMVCDRFTLPSIFPFSQGYRTYELYYTVQYSMKEMAVLLDIGSSASSSPILFTAE